MALNIDKITVWIFCRKHEWKDQVNHMKDKNNSNISRGALPLGRRNIHTLTQKEMER